MKNKLLRSKRRSYRVRKKIDLTSRKTHRLTINKSNRHISCQVIEMEKNHTLISFSTKQASIVKPKASNCNKLFAQQIGDMVGKAMQQKQLTSIVFDKGSYKYHGIVKTFVDAVRQHINF